MAESVSILEGLEITEVVSDENGMRDAYFQKKKETEAWLKDQRDKVRVFAERYHRSLDRQISAE